MSFSQTLHNNLLADIEENLPVNLEAEPSSLILALQNPKAPIVCVSRDPRMGLTIAPHFFFTIENPESNLLPVSSLFCNDYPTLMPLFHNIIGSHTGKFTLVPFLYDRNSSSKEFICSARRCGEALLAFKLESAYTIIDCNLSIMGQGKHVHVDDYMDVFDHLEK
jgi:hypothetical protein